jgi:hypothetical protein
VREIMSRKVIIFIFYGRLSIRKDVFKGIAHQITDLSLKILVKSRIS